MSEALKILGQLSPSASALTDLYTVPSTFFSSISSIIICNHNSSIVINFRISVAIGGADDAPAQYLYYDLPLDSNDTFIATIGMSLGSGDKVRVYSDTANVSFNIFGVEVQ